MAQGTGPERMLVTLGYSGWAAGQLENEIKQNAWLTVAAKDAIIFDLPVEERLPAAMELLGIDLREPLRRGGACVSGCAPGPCLHSTSASATSALRSATPRRGSPIRSGTIDAADARRIAAIDALVREWRPARLVVGLPLGSTANEHEMTRAGKRFARQLEARFLRAGRSCRRAAVVGRGRGGPARAGRGGRKHKHLVHREAAQVILQELSRPDSA